MTNDLRLAGSEDVQPIRDYRAFIATRGPVFGNDPRASTTIPRVNAESPGKRERGDATPFDDLNQLLVELVAGAKEVLGDSLCGAYLQGSFAWALEDRPDPWTKVGDPADPTTSWPRRRYGRHLPRPRHTLSMLRPAVGA